MSDLPTRIEILEEGPREGFQSESRTFPTEIKVKLIEALAETGLKEIDCASFTSEKIVPQMADAEKISVAIRRKPGVSYQGIWLNEKGFRRALETGLDLIPTIFGSASETFLLRNNRRSSSQSLEDQRRMRRLYDVAGLGDGPVYIFTAFGCNYEGDIPITKVMGCVAALLELYAETKRHPTYVCLCDTVGAANPQLVKRLIGELRSRWPDIRIALHLHDTRGLGIANACAGLEMGVSRFDASIGGMGGCPFAGNIAAAGNIATEELVFLCEEMGIATGVDLEMALAAATLGEEIVGHPLPGRITKAGTLSRFRRH